MSFIPYNLFSYAGGFFTLFFVKRVKEFLLMIYKKGKVWVYSR